MLKLIANRGLCVLVLMAGARTLLAAPEPSEVPPSWEIRFRYIDPQRITVKLPTESEPRTFWYILYTVENDSGQTVQYLPTFELVTNSSQVHPAYKRVHPLVYDAIERRHKRTHPFLTEPVRMLGPLLHGEEHARDSVAIWPELDDDVSAFTVYVGGLSGEARQIVNPLYEPDQPQVAREKLPDGSTIEKVVNPKYFTLRKTLVIPYILPGTPATRGQAKPMRQPHSWAMR